MENTEELIAKLSFSCDDLKYQKKKREEAFIQLGILGVSAKAAIDPLITKVLGNEKWEKDLAESSLSRIDENWYLNDTFFREIDNLVKKLRRDIRDRNLANDKLTILGTPAQKAIIRIIEKIDEEKIDEENKFHPIQFLKIQRNTDIKFLNILNKTISESKNLSLLRVSIEAICNFENISEDIKSKIIAFLSHRENEVRFAAIKTINIIFTTNKSFATINEDLALSLFDFLTNDDLESRNAAVNILSNTDNEFIEYCYIAVLEGKGKLNKNDLPEILEKIKLSTKHGEFGHFKIKISEFENNKFWKRFELNKLLEKPQILLENILKIVSKKKELNAKAVIVRLTIEILADIGNKDTHHEEILVENSIKILEDKIEDKDKIIPVLLSLLSHPSPIVREATISLLYKLDKNWLQRKEAISVISAVIDNLDSIYYKETSKAVLSELGSRVLPIINQNLNKQQNRIVQLLIIEILNEFDSRFKELFETLIKLKNQIIHKDVLLELNRLSEKLEKIFLEELKVPQNYYERKQALEQQDEVLALIGFFKQASKLKQETIVEPAINEIKDISDLKNFLSSSLRRAILDSPENEIYIQDRVEVLLIGKGYKKGIDYDREVGRVKCSIKEYKPDFIFLKLKLALEIKLSKTKSKSKKIVDEINADIQAYSKIYDQLLFLVYDVATIRDEDEFKNDIDNEKNIKLLIVKH